MTYRTALGDLTSTISALDTTKLSSALTTLANTFKDTPPDLKVALEGVAQFSSTLDDRDAKLRNLLANANKVTAVLAKRSDQIANLVVNANALLAELLTQRNSVDALMTNLTAASRQISAVVGDNRTQLKPALDKLNGVLSESWTTASRNCSALCICFREVRDVVRRSAGIRTVLQSLVGQPDTGTICAAVHRRGVLRSGA